MATDGVERRVMDPDKATFVRYHDDPVAAARRLASSRIAAFVGEHEFLSTLSKSRVVLPGAGATETAYVAYPTVEHALQAAKSPDAAYRKEILACRDALEAKRRGAKAPGWDKEAWKTQSLVVMEALLRDKFRRHKGLRAQLLATGTQRLVYENEHNDQFWGTCKGKGQNHLGLLLEKVRADENEGLLAVLLWAKQVFQALPDAKVQIEMAVTREGAPLPEAALMLDRKAIVTFGKLAENDVPVAHPSTSRLHSLVVVSEACGPLVVDLEAPNGTFLDDRRLEPFKGAALVSGKSVVALGTSSRRYVFTFDTAADAKRSLALYEVLEDPMKLAAERPELGVFVNNLPKDVTEEDVHEFFSECGTVLQVVLPRHKITQELRGFAIVLFGTEAAVVSALKLDRDPMKGVEVRIKRRKAEDTSHGGGGDKGKGDGGGGGRRRDDDDRRPPRKEAPTLTDGHYGPSASSSSTSGRREEREETARRPRSRSRSRERAPPPPSRKRSRSRSRSPRRDRDRGDRDRDRDRDRRDRR